MKRAQKRKIWLWALALVALAMHLALSFIPSNILVVSLLANMHWQMSAFLVFAALGCLVLDSRRLALVLVAYAAVNWGMTGAAGMPSVPPADPGLASEWVYFQNVELIASRHHAQEMAKSIADVPAKAYVFVEPDPAFVRAFAVQMDRPPDVFIAAGVGGCAIWGDPGSGSVRRLTTHYQTCEAQVGGVPILAVHPFPPVSPKLFQEHLEYLDALAAWLDHERDLDDDKNHSDGNLRLAVGDFNISPMNPHVRQRFNQSSRAHITWGTETLAWLAFAMPLDFAVFNAAEPKLWTTVQRRFGSDHHGVVLWQLN